jgi:hypothetical protein
LLVPKLVLYYWFPSSCLGILASNKKRIISNSYIPKPELGNEQKRAKSWSLGTSKFIIILKLKKLELISSGVADFALA